jgi:hypothetical protein
MLPEKVTVMAAKTSVTKTSDTFLSVAKLVMIMMMIRNNLYHPNYNVKAATYFKMHVTLVWFEKNSSV